MAGTTIDGEITLRSERARIVRLCTVLTGDPDAAEDLAQETLIEAWQHEHALRDPDKHAQWLSGIARNVCLRWRRRHTRESARQVHLDPADPTARSVEDPAKLSDAFDVEIELERKELVALLDRALSLLPPRTRMLLIDRYVEQSPHADLAARLGVSEGAIAKRLERGKLLLRRVLTTELRQEARAYGLVSPADQWRETRIWCPTCGQRRLLGRFTTDRELQLDCAGCLGLPRSIIVRGSIGYLRDVSPAELFADIKGYKPALNRLLAETHAFFGQGIVGRTVRCYRCGRAAPLRISAQQESGWWRYIQVDCPGCGLASGVGTVHWRALELPAGQAFWRAHDRIRTLPDREVEAAGGPAIVSCVESVTGSARLEVVFSAKTLDVIGVHSSPPA